MVTAATQRMDTHGVACGVEAGVVLSKPTLVQSAHINDPLSFIFIHISFSFDFGQEYNIQKHQRE